MAATLGNVGVEREGKELPVTFVLWACNVREETQSFVLSSPQHSDSPQSGSSISVSMCDVVMSSLSDVAL